MELVPTPHGPAGVDVDRPRAPVRALLVLGHGAGGSVDAPDLRAVRDAAVAAGVVVARVTQPYRVAGRRAPAPAGRLDEAFVLVARAVSAAFPGVPAVVGGRSSGGRVACRTAIVLGAVGVVALAFPLHPPPRRGVRAGPPDPARSRSGELRTGVPTLVVNGARDAFGVPPPDPSAGLVVHVVPGADHALATSTAEAEVAGVVVRWLAAHGWADAARAGSR